EAELLPRLAVLFQDAGARSESNVMLECLRSSGGNAETVELVTAELQRRRGEFEEAVRTLEQALDRAPESSRGQILQQLISSEIETARPAWPQLQVLRGRIADRLGRLADAVEAYEQALRSGARNLSVYQWLISDLQQLNRFAEVSQCLGTAGQMAAVSDDLAA